MKKQIVLSKPTRLPELSWDEFYEDISSNWRVKAERLRIRRWRKLKQQAV